MKKNVAFVVSAAMAFSMFASAAMADSAKTTADFKDLAGIDAGLKAKIETLLSNGVFEGVSNDSFGISQNMTRAQFAKVASIVFGLKVDSSIQTSSFSDVQASDPANGWAIPYIEAAKKAGLIDGMTDTHFAPGDNVTVGQLDTVFLKGLGKKVDTSVSPWYADAVKQATELGIHPSGKDGEVSATRADLVVGAYGSLPKQPAPEPKPEQQNQDKVSVASVSSQGDQNVLVNLDKPVDTSKAIFTISKDGKLLPVTTSWSADKKSATLTLSSDDKLTSGSYVVSLGGIDSSAIGTASQTLTIGTISDKVGDYSYTVPESYTLSSVIDNGATSGATGTNGYVTKSEAENPAFSKLAKEIKITVKNASGDEVATPALIESITSLNPSIVKAAVSSNRAYIIGDKTGTTNVTFIYKTIGGDRKTMTVPVTVKNEAVTAQKIEAKDQSFSAYVSVTNGVYSGRFNAYEKMDMIVTDNFGTEYKQREIQGYNFTLGVYFNVNDITGDAAKGDVGTVTVDAAGNVHIAGNVTSFTLNARIYNGAEAAAGVYVRVGQPDNE